MQKTLIKTVGRKIVLSQGSENNMSETKQCFNLQFSNKV